MSRQEIGSPAVKPDEAQDIDFDDEKLLNSMGHPVVLIETTGTVLVWNASMASLTGVSAKQVTDINGVVDALYGRQGLDETVVKKVVAAPMRAHEQYSLTKVDTELEVYRTTVESPSSSGGTRYYVTVRTLIDILLQLKTRK